MRRVPRRAIGHPASKHVFPSKRRLHRSAIRNSVARNSRSPESLHAESQRLITEWRRLSDTGMPEQVTTVSTLSQRSPLRHILDDAIDSAQCVRLAALIRQSELQHIVLTPGERKIAGDIDALPSLLGDVVVGLIDALKIQMREQVEAVVEGGITETGCIISWLSPLDATPHNEEYAYTVLHCDKANNFEYDISALLYLSTHDQDFGGGELRFVDPVSLKEVALLPDAGRLVVFDSGIDNLHRVSPVSWGDRLLLSVWYGRNSG